MANLRRARARTGGFLKEFQEFALKGNVLDLAVAVIIGGAFGKIITSLVEDVLMPALINPTGSAAGTDWRELTIGPDIKIGSFAGAIVDFVIIAFILFLLIRTIQSLRHRDEVAEAPAEPTTDEKLNATLDRLTDVLETKF